MALDPGATMRGTDTAYDPVHDVYLLVVAHGPVFGVFVNSAGVPVTAPFTIFDGSGDRFAHFPRAEYSPHVSNGVGGSGGFLVTWNHNEGRPNYVFGRTVAYTHPARVVSGIQLIADGEQGGVWHETGPAMAYSTSSGRFLVAWRTLHYGIRGRFVDPNGNPQGVPMQLENAGGSRDPGLAWNPTTNDFGLVYTGFNDSGGFTAFRRIRASDGLLSPRTTFGFSPGTFATAIDVSSATGNYVLTWTLHPGTMSATFDRFGNHLATNVVTTRMGFDQALGLSYNDATGTFLAVSSDNDTLEVGAVEVTASGSPNTTRQLITDGARLGSYYPMTTQRRGTNQWDVVYSRDFRGATNQIVGSSTTGGGPGSTPPPTTPPPTSPPPTGGGCTTPDPFVSLGGGTCVNGGWLPPSSPPPTAPPPAPPPPPPPSSTCGTAQPASGWVCVNGGWLPPGHPLATSAPPPPPPPTSPPPSSAGCSTPDPFASIGGGTCVNGGWVPGTSTSGCTGADPFAAIGGGACVNGGWVPRSSTSSCTTADPFATIGGGVCINGGWVPKG